MDQGSGNYWEQRAAARVNEMNGLVADQRDEIQRLTSVCQHMSYQSNMQRASTAAEIAHFVNTNVSPSGTLSASALLAHLERIAGQPLGATPPRTDPTTLAPTSSSGLTNTGTTPPATRLPAFASAAGFGAAHHQDPTRGNNHGNGTGSSNSSTSSGNSGGSPRHAVKRFRDEEEDDWRPPRLGEWCH